MPAPRLTLTAVVALLAALAIVPATASATATVTGTAGTGYTYTGSDVGNFLTITRSGGTLVFKDVNEPVTESSDTCGPGADASEVICGAGSAVLVTVNVNGGQNYADASAGPDARYVMNGGPDGNTLVGSDLNDDLNGGASGDSLQGMGGNDDLDGGGGDDGLQGGAGADVLTGGASDPLGCGDAADYREKTNNLVVTLDGVANDDTGDGDTIGGDIESVFGGTGNDTLTGNDGINCIFGGNGGGTLNGLGAGDELTGGAQSDTLNGGAGDDALSGESNPPQRPAAPDFYNGGDGVDHVLLYTFGCVGMASCELRTINVTLDGQPNDGELGQGSNVGADVEDVETYGDGAANVAGSDAFNVIDTDWGAGNDTVDPGRGSDFVATGDGADAITARDGFEDRINCGPGADTVTVDQFDSTRNCETVDRQDVPNANEDRPPGVAFEAPAAGAKIPANTPTVLRATASDDRGVARVLFMDDDRVVCTDDAAPYDCPYQPRAEDVNRNTLAAVAVDTSEQMAFASRSVTVPRFSASRLTAKTTPRRDRTRPFRFTTSGRLELPAALPVNRTACRGRVSIQVKTGGSTISTRRTTLTRACTYRSRVTFRVPARLVRRALKVTVRFGGNAVVAPKNAKSYFIRTS